MIRGELKKKKKVHGNRNNAESLTMQTMVTMTEVNNTTMHRFNDYARNRIRGRRDEIAAQEWGRKKKYMYKRCTKMNRKYEQKVSLC